jgi:NADH:ubiquinone oxidoreductase subunit 6 (subunit J)
MAASGTLVLAGAPYYRTVSNLYYTGAVFVFAISTNSVAYKQRVLKPGTVRSYEYFGTAVATVRLFLHHISLFSLTVHAAW